MGRNRGQEPRSKGKLEIPHNVAKHFAIYSLLLKKCSQKADHSRKGRYTDPGTVTKILSCQAYEIRRRGTKRQNRKQLEGSGACPPRTLFLK